MSLPRRCSGRLAPSIDVLKVGIRLAECHATAAKLLQEQPLAHGPRTLRARTGRVGMPTGPVAARAAVGNQRRERGAASAVVAAGVVALRRTHFGSGGASEGGSVYVATAVCSVRQHAAVVARGSSRHMATRLGWGRGVKVEHVCLLRKPGGMEGTGRLHGLVVVNQGPRVCACRLAIGRSQRPARHGQQVLWLALLGRSSRLLIRRLLARRRPAPPEPVEAWAVLPQLDSAILGRRGV